MRFILIAVIAGLFLGLLYLARRRMTAPNGPNLCVGVTEGEGEIHIGELPALITAMENGTDELRYAALILLSRGEVTDGINLQLSVEDGRIGFDWILAIPQNIDHAWAFKTFAQARGIFVQEKALNGTGYLRVEPQDPAAFTAALINDLFQYPTDMGISLIFQGFVWEQD